MGNEKRLVAAAAAVLSAGLVTAPVRGATILFADNFNVSATVNPSGGTLTDNTSGNQSGSAAPLTYTTGGTTTATNPIQVVASGPINAGALQFQVTNVNNANYASVSPTGANFSQSPGLGNYQSISFDIDAANGVSTGSWLAVTFGTSSAKANQFVNATDGFGILFRGSGGYQAFDGGTDKSTGTGITGNGTYTATIPAGVQHVELRVSSVAGNPYAGAAGDAVTISAYDNNSATPFYSYTRTNDFASNFITLEGESDGGAVTHYFDNFQVASAPEPAGLGLLGAGALGLLARRRRTA